MAQVIDASGFLFKALGNHTVHTAVDAREELLAWPSDGELHSPEGALPGLSGEKRRARLAGLKAYLDGVDEPFVVGEVGGCREICRVETTESVVERPETTVGVDRESLCADLGGYGWEWVDATGYGVDIHHGTSAQHGIVTFSPDRVETGEGVGLEHGRAVVVPEVEGLDEVVGHPRELLA